MVVWTVVVVVVDQSVMQTLCFSCSETFSCSVLERCKLTWLASEHHGVDRSERICRNVQQTTHLWFVKYRIRSSPCNTTIIYSI